MIGGVVLLAREDIIVTFQRIGMQVSLTVGRWNACPEQPGRGIAARAQGVSHDLTGSTAQGRPQPDNPQAAMPDKTPQFIHSQYVLRLWGRQSRLQGRQRQGFFLTTPSPYCGKPQRSGSSLASCSTPDKPLGSVRASPHHTHWSRDVPNVVGRTVDTGTVSCRWL